LDDLNDAAPNFWNPNLDVERAEFWINAVVRLVAVRWLKRWGKMLIWISQLNWMHN